MKRSILVIKTPENCYDCVLRRCYSCGAVSDIPGYGKELPTNLYKPHWCPLKNIPDKMVVCGKYPQPDRIVPSYKIGFNACIDEILKEDNEDE